MTVAKLPHDHRSWRLPRCEHDVNDFTKRWRDHAGKDYKCERKALYEIGGIKLCKLHAGDVLLDQALAAGVLK